jgi:hypothetical protein
VIRAADIAGGAVVYTCWVIRHCCSGQ